MARIRTVKPELWTSEQFVECSPNARLLFIGLFNFVDDSGVHPMKPMRIKMQIFPADGFSRNDMLEMLHELDEAGLIEVYTVDDAQYLMITGFTRHQRIDQPTYKHPLPNGEIPASVRRTFSERSTSVHPRKGREGKGKEGSNGSDKPNTSTKRATALPDDFTPNARNKELAAELGVSLNTEVGKFTDYHTAKGSKFKDWHAALNNWLRNAKEFQGGKNPPPAGPANLREFTG